MIKKTALVCIASFSLFLPPASASFFPEQFASAIGMFDGPISDDSETVPYLIHFSDDIIGDKEADCFLSTNIDIKPPVFERMHAKEGLLYCVKGGKRIDEMRAEFYLIDKDGKAGLDNFGIAKKKEIKVVFTALIL